MTLLSQLPTIVDSTGMYRTRCGDRICIHTISNGEETFRAKGGFEKIVKGKSKFTGYDIWHVSGRYDAMSLSGKDIVEKLS